MAGERPIWFSWDGDNMICLQPKLADKNYVVGEKYILVPFEDRSEASHKHQFAWLREAWRQLPEDIADLYPNPDILRKKALVDAGYYNETIVDAGSNAAAIRVASAFQGLGDFAVIFVRGHFVIRRTAKSQSRRKMNKQEFDDSKNKVLEIVSQMIGVSPDELQRNSGH